MTVIDNLKRFNRKERFYVIGFALDNQDFQLGQKFREKLSEKLPVKVPDKLVVGQFERSNRSRQREAGAYRVG